MTGGGATIQNTPGAEFRRRNSCLTAVGGFGNGLLMLLAVVAAVLGGVLAVEVGDGEGEGEGEGTDDGAEAAAIVEGNAETGRLVRGGRSGSSFFGGSTGRVGGTDEPRLKGPAIRCGRAAGCDAPRPGGFCGTRGGPTVIEAVEMWSGFAGTGGSARLGCGGTAAAVLEVPETVPLRVGRGGASGCRRPRPRPGEPGGAMAMPPRPRPGEPGAGGGGAR